MNRYITYYDNKTLYDRYFSMTAILAIETVSHLYDIIGAHKLEKNATFRFISIMRNCV